MSLNVGELVARLSADEVAFQRATERAGEAMQRLARNVAASAERAEQESVIEPTVDDSEVREGLADVAHVVDAAIERAEDSAVVEPTVDDDRLRRGLNQAEGEVESFGDRMAGFTAAAGAAAGVAFGVALVGGFEQQAVGSRISAQLGTGTAMSGHYGELAGRLYAKGYGEGLAEVGEAVTAVASTFPDLWGDELELATERALNLASAFDIDVARAAQTVGTLLNTGLVKDATQAFDLVVAASQRVPAHLREDVMDASDEYGQFFKSLGFNGQQAFELLVQGSAKGMYGIDKLGDAIKESTLLLTDIGNTGVTDAYKAIGLDAKQMSNEILAGGDRAQTAFQKIVTGLLGVKDPSDQAAAAVALFGTPIEDMNKTEIPEFLRMLGGVGDGMVDFAGAADDMGATLSDNAAHKLEVFKRQVMGVATEAGAVLVDSLMEAGTVAKQVFGPALEAGGRVLEKYGGWLAPVGVFLAVVVGAILAVVAAQKVWMAVQAAHTAVMAAWNTVMAANPIGLIIIAIIALVAALIYAYHHSETFRAVVDATFKAIGAAAMWLWNTVLKPTFEAIGAVLSWFGQFFLATGMLIWTIVKAVFEPAFRGIGVALAWVWNTLLKPAIDGIAAAFQWLGDKIGKIFGAISGPISAAFSTAVAIVKGAINAIIGLINMATRFINNSVLSKLNNVPGVNFPMIPAIPKLATGGTVQPSPGGTPVIMGDGGEVEYGIPHSDMEAIIADAVRAAGGGGETTVRLIIDGTGVLRGIREEVRVQGGDVQTVLAGA